MGHLIRLEFRLRSTCRCKTTTLCRTHEEIPKQGCFVENLANYNSSQWVEFFQMTPSTAQRLVEELGPFFHEQDGEYS